MTKQQIVEKTKDMKAFTIDVESNIEEVKPENGKDFKLEELYKHTQSDMVQVVPLQSSGLFLVCDEEGMWNGKPVNDLATVYLDGDVYMPPEGQLGKVLICSHGMIE